MPRRLRATAAGDLARYLTSAPASTSWTGAVAADDPLATELVRWLVEGTRFRAFADLHRDKIRRKLRQASDPEGQRDVRAELLVASRLLEDRHIDVAYEPGPQGGPDFALTYRGGRPFNLEVTRPRRAAEAGIGRPIIAKLRQLPSAAANVLLLALPAAARAPDIGSAVRAIRSRADAKEEAFFQRRGFADTRDFYDRFLRLSAVIAWPEDGSAEAWTNGSARVPVPARALGAVAAVLRVSSPSDD